MRGSWFKIGCCAACLLLLLAGTALAGVSDKDFQAQTTQQMYNLCAASEKDPLYKEAIHFCHGYLLGAFAHHLAINDGPKGVKLFCLPDNPPSRDEAVALFVKWMAAHPQHMGEKPVETEFRFLMEQWPCPK